MSKRQSQCLLLLASRTAARANAHEFSLLLFLPGLKPLVCHGPGTRRAVLVAAVGAATNCKWELKVFGKDDKDDDDLAAGLLERSYRKAYGQGGAADAVLAALQALMSECGYPSACAAQLVAACIWRSEAGRLQTDLQCSASGDVANCMDQTNARTFFELLAVEKPAAGQISHQDLAILGVSRVGLFLAGGMDMDLCIAPLVLDDAQQAARDGRYQDAVMIHAGWFKEGRSQAAQDGRYQEGATIRDGKSAQEGRHQEAGMIYSSLRNEGRSQAIQTGASTWSKGALLFVDQ
jgi:hypothetical protein